MTRARLPLAQTSTVVPVASCSSPKVTRDWPARSMPVSLCARLPTRRGLLEEVVQQPPRGVQLLGAAEGVLDLPEDLALADDHRVQAAGHREEWWTAPVLVVDVQVRGELLQADAAVLGEECGQLGDTGVELVHVGVELDAVAGGQDGGLGGRLGG